MAAKKRETASAIACGFMARHFLANSITQARLLQTA